jgi:eukaryotic-like serine/threonine-protein kinase
LEFAAPEQFKDSLSADARSDLYSLGATFYATMTGYQPCPSTDRPQKRLPALTELVPEIPVEVSNLVMKLLEVDRNKRPASAEEVAAAFAPWANSRPLETDFSSILAKRKKSMEQRLAKSPGSRSATAISSRSTARPGSVSSVAMAVPLRRSNPGMDLSEFPEPDVTKPPALSDLVGGPALEWSQETPRMGQAGLVLKPANLPGQIPLQKDDITVGRSAECHLQIIDSTVSSKHCEFHFDGRRWWITDLKSLNGTRVNGHEVKRRQVLQPGDDIRIGNGPRFRACWPGMESRGATRPLQLVLVALLLVAVVAGVMAVLFSQGVFR